MSSAGHVLDMIKRSKYNDSIRQKRVERISKLKDIYQEEIRKNHHIDFQNPNVSKVELNEIKARIRVQLKTKRRKALIYTILLTVSVIGGVVLALKAWFSYLS